MPKQLILQFLEVRSPGGRNRSSTWSLIRPNPGAGRAEFRIGGTGEESTPKLIQVVGQIQFFVV